MSPQTPANGRRTDLAWLALILAVGGTCRFLWLGWASVWEDEIVWMTLARMDGPTALVRALPTLDAGGSPLHPLLLQAWLGVVGDSVIAARVASALCGMATIALIYAIGRRYFDGPTGLAAALLAALNPLDVHHAREVRVYPWLVFLTCAGWFLLDSFRQGAPAWKRVLYASVLIALLYSHPLGSLMVVALGVGYLVTRRESRLGGWGWIGINLCAAAAFAPWASRHLDHPPQVTVPHWDAWVLLEWPEGFTGGRAEAVGACVALVLFGMIWRAKRGPKTGLDRGDRLTLAWFFVPTLLLLAYSATRHPIFGPRRYLLFVGPAYLLLIARPCGWRPWRPSRWWPARR